jgi:hypothetical protein
MMGTHNFVGSVPSCETITVFWSGQKPTKSVKPFITIMSYTLKLSKSKSSTYKPAVHFHHLQPELAGTSDWHHTNLRKEDQ